MVKKIGIRVLIVALMLVGFNYIYKATLWQKDLATHAHLLPDIFTYQDSVEMLYFGESSNFSYNAEKDSITARISDLIYAHYPSIKAATINSSALHAGTYLPLIKRLPDNTTVKTIIVTLNMRTFNAATIHSRLETAMMKSKVMYLNRPELLNRFLMSLNFYDNKTEQERDEDMWEDWTYDTLTWLPDTFPYRTVKDWCAAPKFVQADGSYNTEKRSLADHYVKAYAFQIDESNPRVQDFDEIVKVCQQKGIQPVFNLLAENVQYADSLIGDELVYIMRKNRDYLVKRYREQGAIVVDNLEAVEGWDYTDQNWTTEHYGQTGRLAIAHNVAIALKAVYGDYYQESPLEPK